MLPEASHPWNEYTPVPAHMSLAIFLEKDVAVSLLKQLVSRVQSTYVTLTGELFETCEGEFSALEWAIQPSTQPTPSWWPKGAHISFGYKYGSPYTPEEVRTAQDRIQGGGAGTATARLCRLEIRKCKGHFSRWHCDHAPHTALEAAGRPEFTAGIASLKSERQSSKSAIKEWIENFTEQNGRGPNVDEKASVNHLYTAFKDASEAYDKGVALSKMKKLKVTPLIAVGQSIEVT